MYLCAFVNIVLWHCVPYTLVCEPGRNISRENSGVHRDDVITRSTGRGPQINEITITHILLGTEDSHEVLNFSRWMECINIGGTYDVVHA